MKPLILIGGGGHCKSAIDVIEAQDEYKIVAITDKKVKIGDSTSGYKVTAEDAELPALIDLYKYCLVTIGQLKSSTFKYRLFRSVKEAGGLLPVIVSPHAVVSKHADLGEGTIVFHQSMINSGCNIGDNCIINSGAIIEHDSVIGNHTHIAPGAIVSGHCKIGNRSMIGSGSVVIQEVTIGDQVVVGAGSTVIRSIKEPGVYVGSPAKRLVEK